jgi:hypothetical protein
MVEPIPWDDEDERLLTGKCPCDRCKRTREDMAELTRWRALASTPEICGRELGTRRDAIGRLAKEVTALTAQNHRLVGRIDELKAADTGARGYLCPGCSLPLTMCLEHGLYVRTDENQCGACWRGEP